MRQNVPDYIKPYVDRAGQYESKEKYDEAITIYREALDRYPNIAALRNNLGCCLANLERYEEAKNEFLQAIALTLINRQKGIVVPDSYPEEPQQNLRTVQAYIDGTQPAPLPGRIPSCDSSLPFHDPFRPGMNFPQYVFLFLAASPIGQLMALTGLIAVGILWWSKSPHFPAALVIACGAILIAAFIAYIKDPRLRKNR